MPAEGLLPPVVEFLQRRQDPRKEPWLTSVVTPCTTFPQDALEWPRVELFAKTSRHMDWTKLRPCLGASMSRLMLAALARGTHCPRPVRRRSLRSVSCVKVRHVVSWGKTKTGRHLSSAVRQGGPSLGT